jgi:hypothetical protein
MNYPLLSVFLSILFFFSWALWIFLVIWILIDVFRNHNIGGWATAGWVILIVFLPLIGVLIYLGVHGKDMRDRQDRLVADEQEYYVARAAASDGRTSTAFQLSKLADLHDRGVLTDAEFEREKQKILA